MLSSLDRSFRPYAEELVAAARSLDRAFQVTSARRTYAEQARLYRRFRAGLAQLPAAPPGHSRHEVGLAVDIARRGTPPFEDPYLYALGAAWSDAGWGWWPSDPVHFEAAW
jgi:D-alanyl-D-alanine carboxypeptidase